MKLSHFLAYILTFMSYAGLHSLRQGWSLSKTQLKTQFNIDKLYFGIVDTSYLIAYSLGMMTIGNLSSKMQLKYFVSIGMVLAALFYMMVAFFYQITGQFNYVLVVVFMCLNGFFQSSGWPGIMGIFGNWFQKGKLGVLLGIWAINANVGNIIAELLCNVIQEEFNASWTYNFLITGIFTIIVAILIMLFLQDKPKRYKQVDHNPLLQDQSAEQNESMLTNQPEISQEIVAQQVDLTETQSSQKVSSPSIFHALCFPRVPSYVIGYAMLKGCIYGLLFWLPTYLTQKDLESQKGYISAMVDTGSFIGGLAIGYLGDKYKYRAIFLSPLLFLSSIVMFSSAYFLTNAAVQYYIAMFLVGITIGGPYNIIGTVITIDLGKQTKNMGGSTTKISALVEGTAAIFAAGSQTIISILPETAIFYVFFAECLIAAIVLLPLCLSDYKEFSKDRNVVHQGKIQE